MGKTFNDDEMLVWEAYPSGIDEGHPQNSHIVFNCLSDRARRPRRVECVTANEADAERVISQASEPELRTLLKRSNAID